MAQWQAQTLANYRTWVRAPGPHPFQYYFSINIPMQLQYSSTPCIPQIKPATRSISTIQGPRSEEHGTHESTLEYVSGEVKEAKAYWAQIAGPHPPN